MARKLEALTEEELEAVTIELQEVLGRHNVEMGVSSTINIMKVVESEDEPDTTTPTEGEETNPETA